MNDRYLDAKALAFEALTLSGDARDAFLEQRCGDDTALRDEARWLIHAAETLTGERLLTGWQHPIPDGSTPALHAGEQVSAANPGQYRVIRQIGEGGMGVVYLAQREEGDAHQQVALKFLGAATLGSAQHARRFAAEHRILATLRHPNIAHLLEGGTTADGRPFIAMEYVDGLRIDQWCAAHAPTLQQRLALFLKVCAAIEHAHQHLVIHRDLKPANILVNADGEPKLLDFGIARLLDDTAQGEASRTQVLTPAYASPEQVEGAPLTTAADVWALGVVLYELLAGQRPHQALDGHRLGEAILSGAIEPPSRRARRGAADAQPDADGTQNPRPRLPPVRIPADVDAIVLKALRRDPQARYASVAALADDIRRFLQHRPVLARRGHALYRLGRLVRRQRWAIAAGVAAIAVAAGFAIQRERQLDEVLAERNKAEAVSAFMRDLFAKASPDAGRDGEHITVREVLDSGTDALGQRGDLDPATKTSLRLSIADAYSALGMESSALPLFEAALRDLRERGASIDDIADVMTEISTAHQMSGKNQLALDVAQEGMSLFPQDQKKPLAWIRLRERELINLSLMGTDTPEQSLEGYRALIPLLESAGSTDSGTATNLLGNVWFGISQAHNRLNQTEAAIEAMANAMEVTSGSGLSAKNRLAYAQRHATLVMEKNPAEGVRLLHEIDDRHVRLFGEISGSRAVLLNQISVGYGRLKNNEEQVKWQARAVDMARQALGTENRLFLQMATNQAVTLNRMGQHASAMEAIESVLPGLRRLQAPGVDTVNLAYALSTRGDILLDSGDSPEAALDSFEQAGQLLGDTAGEFIVVQYNLARGLVRAHVSLKDRDAARSVIGEFDALLDRDGFPADSRWRDSAAKLRDLIPSS